MLGSSNQEGCGTFGERSDAYRAWGGALKEIDHLEDKGVDGRIPLNWIIRKQGREAWTGLIWFRIGTSGGLL